MPANRNEDRERQSVWLGVAKGAFLVLFALACLLLTQDMVEHHFFSGGALNYRMSSR